MAELLSVGLDVGTTTTQLIASRLTVENRASGFAVPHLEIAQRQVIYESAVHFTPLIGENLVDGEGVRAILEQEYQKAGITAETVDTGAVIITGETSRRENAKAVLHALSQVAGDFVVATAGPSLESVLAAKGAGAAAYSQKTGKTVLHMDIGGGTSNLALIEAGKITATGCMNVGGRLMKLDRAGKITYISPVLNGIGEFVLGQQLSRQQVENLAQKLVQALEMAAGLRPATDLLQKLWTEEAGNAHIAHSDKDLVLSFSGGVADCIEKQQDWLNFGDIGPVLGQAIRKSRLCSGEYRLGEQTIRATVIGAGCHSAQLSGSTVFHRNIRFPLKNLAVARISGQEQTLPNLASIIQNRLQTQEQTAVLALPGFCAPDYAAVVRLAKALATGFAGKPAYIVLEQDMAKALGQVLALHLPPDAPCLCIDNVALEEGSFLNVAAPVGPALPVVIKTLILGG